MITRIKTVAIYVDDQQASTEFYTNSLGFEIKRSDTMTPTAKWIELAPPGSDSHIVLYPKSMMPNWKEHKPSIVYQCDDINKTYQELSEKGVKFKEIPQKMTWGFFAIFLDLDGNEFVLTT
jgi:lactoylglutathione lyase